MGDNEMEEIFLECWKKYLEDNGFSVDDGNPLPTEYGLWKMGVSVGVELALNEIKILKGE